MTRLETPPAAIVQAISSGGPRHCLLLFDFDGTLADFEDDPDATSLKPSRADLLNRLAARPDTTLGIVSGRHLAALRQRTAWGPDVYLAGLHGLQIEGPGGSFLHPGAEAARASVHSAREAVSAALTGFAGIVIEDKELAFTVHWRLAPPPARDAAHHAVIRTLAGRERVARLKAQPGIDHVDVLPDVPWNKGDAVRWISSRIESTCSEGVWPLFVGDDLTDESAFAAIADQGVTVLVGDRPSAARYRLRNPSAVEDLLRLLAAENPVPGAEYRVPGTTTESRPW